MNPAANPGAHSVPSPQGHVECLDPPPGFVTKVSATGPYDHPVDPDLARRMLRIHPHSPLTVEPIEGAWQMALFTEADCKAMRIQLAFSSDEGLFRLPGRTTAGSIRSRASTSEVSEHGRGRAGDRP